MRSGDAGQAHAGVFSRRACLKWAGAGLMGGILGAWMGAPGAAYGAGSRYEGTDEELMDEIEEASFRFFWDETDPRTGLTRDRAYVNGGDTRKMASIAGTGFGLTALCIGDTRSYKKPLEILNRVRATLRFAWQGMQHVHGFYYHFMDMETGQRWRKSELSSVDTALFLCGVLTAREYFDDAEIQDLATKIYDRVEWPWMMNSGPTFSMGWFPEGGFISSQWDHYSECMMIYLLAIGSTTHPIPADAWKAWKRPLVDYEGMSFIAGRDPLFTHQFSHAWFDFRNKRDNFADYFTNSVTATKAHKLFCLSLAEKFPDYAEDLWGISASDSQRGYVAWGGPPEEGHIDGSIVPCATGGSVPFVYDDCMLVLRTIRGRFERRAWGKYSYVDAFNPLNGWFDTDVVAIDLGITMLMIENQRTEFVWKTFMKNSESVTAMDRAGFREIEARLPAKKYSLRASGD